MRRVLVADDAPTERAILSRKLQEWGYLPVVCKDGDEVWALVESGEAPDLMVLDWLMPGLDGVELCRRIRALEGARAPFILLLTGLAGPASLAAAFEAGANDYVVKPFDPVVLAARLRNGARILDLQDRLSDRVQALEEALAKVKRLQGLLPICSYCKRIRSDENFWAQVEAYLAEHTDVQFTHSICPSCYAEVVEPQLREMEEAMQREGHPGHDHDGHDHEH
ncbi:MAG: response regulator transcription factor [Myxococcales bacterium]|nr:response regulator transcription factor [Myxococcales bacterium]MCB9647385.1 response regulator transcription factor [Deltaproteobacteria bacterium]